MKMITFLIGLPAIFCLMFYGVGFIYNHKTQISKDEIFISRIGIMPGSHTEYAVNLKTGDEKIFVHSPFFGDTWFVDYEGQCTCATMVRKAQNFHISLTHEKEIAYYSTGKTVRKHVPYNEVSDKFEEGLAIRNKLKEQYADLISKARATQATH